MFFESCNLLNTSQLEPPGLFRSDNKRGDGIVMVSWSNGKCLTWDAACADTFVPSYVVLLLNIMLV